jgi:hypothetical protein
MINRIINAVTGETTEEAIEPIVVSQETLADDARELRSVYLQLSDSWALSDRTMTAEQTAYRQALRDVTGQANFPNNIDWPQEP